MNNHIVGHLDQPEKLEELYYRDPKKFQSSLAQAIIEHPESETLKVWNARLTYSPQKLNVKSNTRLFATIIISLLSLFLVKTPTYFSIAGGWFYPRFVPLIIFTSLIAYFISNPIISSRQKKQTITAIAICVIIMMVLPENESSSSIIMSQIHMPMVLLSLLAWAYMADDWKTSEARLRYIRYIGEVIIYTTLILLGGVVLTLITLGLFSLIGVSISQWYMDYVVIWGLVASPLVATYLYDSVLNRDSKLATLIANIFSPLFLITVSGYLIAMFFAQKNPYDDRDFLIIFNGLLIIVWGITVFSISGGRNFSESKYKDTINIALVAITLIINAIALSAIIFRLFEYGVTPNRIAVTGENIIIFIHLILIFLAYITQLKTETKLDSEQLMRSITNYLPIYTAWSIFIVMLLPIIFQFQ